jgi:hypothetical protein
LEEKGGPLPHCARKRYAAQLISLFTHLLFLRIQVFEARADALGSTANNGRLFVAAADGLGG